jgi:hypothetical protein
VTLEELVETLRRDVPGTRALVQAHLEHLPGGDEFVLMGLLRDHAVVLFGQGRTAELDRLLTLVDHALSHGDEELADAVIGDFIATTPPWDPEMDAFVATWPVHLRAQASVETARFNSP